MTPTQVILAALALYAAFISFVYDRKVEQYNALKAEVVAAKKAAEIRAAEINAQHEEVVKDVSNAWNAQIPGLREAAVAEYRRRAGNGADLCLRPHGVLQPVYESVGNDVPRDAESPAAPVPAEQEQLACTPEFIGVCAEDALARNLTREWALRNNLTVGD